MTTDGGTICVINASQPTYQPNLYICRENSACCTAGGQPACCGQDITIDEFVSQSTPIVLVFVTCLLVAAIVRFIFYDEDPQDDDDGTYKEIRVEDELMEAVDDPVFGTQFEEKTIRYAFVEKKEQDRPSLRQRKSLSEQQIGMQYAGVVY